MANEVAVFSVPEIRQIGEAIAKSGLFGIKTVDQAVTLCLIAQAEGRHPALAARDYHIISGTPAKKAESMLRDFLSAGGRVEWHALTDTEADATFSHPAGGSARISWDAARVKRAELDKNAMHRKYPRQMLRSRVVSEGVRTVWPMATGGMYVPEEVADFASPSRDPIDVTPRADLDRFAALPSTDAVDPHTGEILGSDEISDDDLWPAADAAAQKGTQAFRDWWKDLPATKRDLLRDDIPQYQATASAADKAAATDEDPFGLPPPTEQPSSTAAHDERKLGSRDPAVEGVVMEQDRYESGRMAEDRYQALNSAQTAPPASESRDPGVRPPETERTHSAPRADAAITITGQTGVEVQDLGYLHPAMAHAEGTQRPFATTATARPGGDGSNGDGGTKAGNGPTATTTASRSEPPDLLGDPPAENLAVPLPRDPNSGDLAFFARQMLSLIDEAPRTPQRIARIKAANELGIAKLKIREPYLHDQVQAALARKAEPAR